MQLRIGLMLSWLSAWVLLVLIFWISWDVIENPGVDDRKRNSEFMVAAGAIGLIVGLVGAIGLLTTKLSLFKNLSTNAGAWAGVAVPLWFIIIGGQQFRVLNNDEPDALTNQDYTLSLALVSFILACAFTLLALLCRGEQTSADRGIFKFLHVIAILAFDVSVMMYYWSLYAIFECEDGNTAADCSDEQKGWWSIAMIVAYASAGVALVAAITDGLKDGIVLGTVAMGGLFGAFLSIRLAIADGDCDDTDCQKDAFLSAGTIGTIASAVLFILFCMRSTPKGQTS